MDLDYVLPLRWDDDTGLEELTAYLLRLSRNARIIVVDGSPPEIFDRHARTWGGFLHHVRPDPGLPFANGKVSGVITGMRLARAERVIIADDDVRYGEAELAAVAALLDGADLVRPQNYFDPLPWHARWDSARTLLNRSLGADYPGTFGVRNSTFREMGGYDGDVLFENLELIRTVRAHGGRERRPLDLYVRRLPPEPGRFWSQRVRQAYDDLAQPVRMAAFLAVLPSLAAALLRRRHRVVLAGAGLAVGLAEVGRRRAGGRRVFPWTVSLFAPVWILERAVCSWLALAARFVRGGVPYAGRRLRTAAHPVRGLRPGRGGEPSGGALGPTRCPEARGLVRPVAERLGGGPAAAAQRHGRPAGVDGLTVLGEQGEGPPQQERPVLTGRHRDRNTLFV